MTQPSGSQESGKNLRSKYLTDLDGTEMISEIIALGKRSRLQYGSVFLGAIYKAPARRTTFVAFATNGSELRIVASFVYILLKQQKEM